MEARDVPAQWYNVALESPAGGEPGQGSALTGGGLAVADASDEIRRVVTVFRELRSGVTTDGRTALKVPSGSLSTAEAISVVTGGWALAAHFGDGVLRAADVAGGITGAVIKDPVADRVAWTEYLETVVRQRSEWRDFYRACREVVE